MKEWGVMGDESGESMDSAPLKLWPYGAIIIIIIIIIYYATKAAQ